MKIADFGVARIEASNPHDMTGETGTLGYMAPEVYKTKILHCTTLSGIITLIDCDFLGTGSQWERL